MSLDNYGSNLLDCSNLRSPFDCNVARLELSKGGLEDVFGSGAGTVGNNKNPVADLSEHRELSTVGCVQRSIKLGNDVLKVFDTNRQANQSVRDAHLCSLSGRDGSMRCPGRM